MKFLIMIDDSQQKPTEAYVQMEAQERWLTAARKKNAIEAIYALAGNHGAVIIVDVENHEALDELVVDMPVACSGAELKVMPLCDYGASMKRLGAQFKRTLAKMKSGG